MNVKTKHGIIFLFCVVLISGTGYAQYRKPENMPKYDLKPYHFGFMLGFNEMDFTLRQNSLFMDTASVFLVEPVPQLGFNVGIVSNLRLGEYFDLRFIPGLAFGDRKVRYLYANERGDIIEEEKNIESTFIELPLLLKYKSKRMRNARAYIVTGLKYSIDLASDANKKNDNDEVDEDYIALIRDDIAAEAGVGFDFYFTWFKFATELKMAYGFKDVFNHEDTFYAYPIDHLNSKVFTISFLFE